MVDLGKTFVFGAEDTRASAPGWKTTEFWITLMGTFVSFLIAQNIAVSGSVWATALSGALVILGALGYTASRSVVKRERIRAASTLASAHVDYLKIKE